MKEIHAKARTLMKGYCRVCPVCDGRVCAGEVPGMGGLGTGSSFKDNIRALAEIQFNMRCLHDVVTPDLSVSLLGFDLSLPVLAAPIGGVSFNMGGGMPEDEYILAKLTACVEAGTVGCTGDGVPDFIHESGFAAVKALDGKGIPFIKPWEDQELFTKLDKALGAGAEVVGVDVDAAGLVTLRKMGRPVAPKPVSELAAVIRRTKAKFVVKGVMTPDEAKLCVDAGAAGIVVSNHGGRVLDGTPGTARVLREVADAVRGQIAVLADGGVRSGADVLRMLALGADAVMIGRPFSVAVLGGGKEGAAQYLEKIRQELTQCMVLTGTASVREVDSRIIRGL
ncbi:alpha-hydroxy-acid oxidizing protein [Desulfonatronum thiodismutans]|uniref:alpha-hydroxy-acid oxidizing protein n=1 Tax=Desulfonatronum thiodismutans TaxID=159290 RepID=UPI0004ABD59A|nr:alpha-hydroxy-acid oxidizing protein [Desulfonatronum thiodismutans]